MYKKELEILLSRLEGFVKPSAKLEQYVTSSRVAADLLWNAFVQGNVEGKVIADLGCGPGILGLGALLLGAKKVYFVDIDDGALALAQRNKVLLEKLMRKKLQAVFFQGDVRSFEKKGIQVVFQNPPFGVQQEHMDQVFLEQAFLFAPYVYSFHKYSTKNFVEGFALKKNYFVSACYRYEFPLKKEQKFHTSRIKYIDVACWLFVRK